jgi:hypothetical protein
MRFRARSEKLSQSKKKGRKRTNASLNHNPQPPRQKTQTAANGFCARP